MQYTPDATDPSDHYEKILHFCFLSDRFSLRDLRGFISINCYDGASGFGGYFCSNEACQVQDGYGVIVKPGTKGIRDIFTRTTIPPLTHGFSQ